MMSYLKSIKSFELNLKNSQKTQKKLLNGLL